MTDGAAALAQIRASRGYLLSYHRLMAAHDPPLLLAYDALYHSLTLVPRALSPTEREIVWLALLVAAGQAQGRIHVDRAVALGMSPDIIAQAGCLGAGGAAADIPESLARLCRLVASAARGATVTDTEGLPRAWVAEGLSFLMIPCGIFRFLSATPGAMELLEAEAPDLATHFRGFMNRLVGVPRALPPPERDTVLGVLAGLNDAASPLPLVAAIRNWSGLDFMARHWLPTLGRAERYLAAFPRDAAAELAGFVGQAALGHAEAARLHLPRAFAAGATPAQVAEAITYLRLHATGAAFIRAVDIWSQAAESGACPPPFPPGEAT
jgi:alkylhydroperoxidase/carboxymuconolactone decarboxylase family protein YurZ